MGAPEEEVVVASVNRLRKIRGRYFNLWAYGRALAERPCYSSNCMTSSRPLRRMEPRYSLMVHSSGVSADGSEHPIVQHRPNMLCFTNTWGIDVHSNSSNKFPRVHPRS